MSNAASSSLDDVLKIWAAHDPATPWPARQYLELGQQASEFGQSALALDVLQTGIQHWPQDSELQYATALAFSRTGALGRCETIIAKLLSSEDLPPQLRSHALALAGKLAKTAFQRTRDQRNALRSADKYREAFELTADYFSGINTATMLAMAGNQPESETIARRVLSICEANPEPASHWWHASLGEACLLCGEQSQAITHYAAAVKLAGTRFGDIASMKSQVVMLQNALNIGSDVLELLRIPNVVCFSGHMIDQPDRPEPRFPAESEAAIAANIGKALDQLDAQFGYSSAACGADILFIEAMQKRGGETNIILPFAQADFVRESVAFAGEGWVERFHTAIERATTVHYATSESYLGDDVLYRYANDVFSGMARLRAEQLKTDIRGLVVADTSSSELIGGAMETLNDWQARNINVTCVPLLPVESSAVVDEKPEGVVAAIQAPTSKRSRSIKSMIFADVTGFSQIDEALAPSFFVEFMDELSKTLLAFKPAPLLTNTWGDAFFIVFEELEHAAEFALLMRDHVVNRDWTELGLPSHTNIRIALHSGPVYDAFEPLMGRTNYFGQHVNRTARMEPVTTPGSVSVSEQAACLLRNTTGDRFRCDHLGQVALAKAYGSGNLYRLRRNGAVE